MAKTTASTITVTRLVGTCLHCKVPLEANVHLTTKATVQSFSNAEFNNQELKLDMEITGMRIEHSCGALAITQVGIN